jgi:hypothetical protein
MASPISLVEPRERRRHARLGEASHHALGRDAEDLDVLAQRGGELLGGVGVAVVDGPGELDDLGRRRRLDQRFWPR